MAGRGLLLRTVYWCEASVGNLESNSTSAACRLPRHIAPQKLAGTNGERARQEPLHTSRNVIAVRHIHSTPSSLPDHPHPAHLQPSSLCFFKHHCAAIKASSNHLESSTAARP